MDIFCIFAGVFKMSGHILHTVIVTLSLAIALSGSAHGSAEWADSVVELPGVSVTAVKMGNTADRRRPVSATVAGRRALERANVVDLHSLGDMTPNFHIPRYGSRLTSSIYVRGIGARIDQPAVGLTIDNLPVMNKDSYDLDLDDMARVDMIRGPQSALYGRGTMGGLINVTTLSPLDYEGLRARVDWGTHGTYRAAVSYYQPLGANAGVSGGLSLGGMDGYYRNSFNNSRVGTTQSLNAWYKASWRGAGGWSVDNTGRYSRALQQGYPYQSVEQGVIAYNDTCHYNRDTWMDGLTVAWRRGPWAVTSVTSVQHLDDTMTLDQDFLPLSYFTLTQRRRETSVTQELMVNRRGRRYDWLAGVFAFTRHTSMRAPVTFLPDGISRLIEEKRNQMNPLLPIGWDEDSFVLDSEFAHPTRGLGVYHNSTLRLGRLTLAAALRLDIEQPRLRYHSHTTTAYTIYDLRVPGVTTVFDRRDVAIDERGSLSHTYVELLPRLSATLDVAAIGGTVYATFAKGYKPGGYNTQMFSDFLQQQLMQSMGLGVQYDVDDIISYRPERSYNYEAGAHASLWGGRLGVDASVFYIDCRDQQLTRFPDGTTTGRVMDNAGRTRSVGAEVSASLNISRHWDATASWGHADARFVDYNDGIHDYARRHVPYAPLNTLHGTLIYNTPVRALGISRLEAVAAVHGVGPVYWNEENTARQGFYAPVRLSVSARWNHLTLRLWMDNVNGVRYSTFYFKSMGNEFVQRGAPRTAGVSVSVELGRNAIKQRLATLINR